jgi:hypothetical protein
MNALIRFAIVIAVAAFVGGCSTGVEPGEDRDLFPAGNQPPTTEIVNPQLSGQEASFSLLVSWKGYDEDGTIAGFEVAIDDTSEWFRTTAFESLFTFRADACCLVDTVPRSNGADSLVPLSYDFHTLFVRAIDNEGAEDATPDHVSFTSTNLFPKTVILRGPSGSGGIQITAPTVILEWEGQDDDGVVVGYRYRLDERDWVEVGADCTLVRFTELPTAEFVGDRRGIHQFVVISIDDAGAEEQLIDEPRNKRRWESVRAISGTLVIESNVMGSRSGVSDFEGQIFEGTRVFFDWRGDASLYGGVIQCYQHAFDQQEVFSACDLGATHFPPDRQDFVPTIGSHTLFVNAFDDAGQTLRATFPFVVLRGPGSIDPANRRILYIDDFNNGGRGSGSAEFPGDPKEDAFWDTLLAGYPRSSFDCDIEDDIPSSRIIGENSTIIWYVDDLDTQLETSNLPFNFRNPMGPYINAGGNLILCGNQITNAFTPDNHFDPGSITNPGCPHHPENSYQGGCGFCLNWFPAFCDTGLSFIYDFFKVSASFNASLDGEEKTNLRSMQSLAPTLVPDLALDFNKKGFGADSLPLLSHGLADCESYDMREIDVDDPDIVIPLWSYIDNEGVDHGPCGFYVPKSTTTGRGAIVVIGFPPYYTSTFQMQEIMRTFLDLFGERFGG